MTTSHIQRLLVPPVASERTKLRKNAVHDKAIQAIGVQAAWFSIEGCRHRFVALCGASRGPSNDEEHYEPVY